MGTRQLTGEEIEEIKLNARDHFWPHARPAGDMSEDLGLKVVKSAKGIWVEDANGDKYLDLISGMFLKAIGHGRIEIAKAVYNQMADISYSPGGTVTPVTAEQIGRAHV